MLQFSSLVVRVNNGMMDRVQNLMKTRWADAISKIKGVKMHALATLIVRSMALAGCEENTIDPEDGCTFKIDAAFHMAVQDYMDYCLENHHFKHDSVGNAKYLEDGNLQGPDYRTSNKYHRVDAFKF